MGRLEVRAADKWFRREDGRAMQVLNQLTFDVAQGQVTALVGPSGCGKTTLLNALVGLERLDSGDLAVIGDDGQRLHRPLIGYVFQTPRLLPWKRVGDNIRLALLSANIPRNQWEGRVHRYLELVGLGEFVDQYPLYLSGGMRQRVGLARALAIESAVVLMDEPFASVDELTARHLRETTRALCEQLHRTVLFVTHNLAEAAYMSDVVLILSARPARVQDTVLNPLPTPRRWGPDVYQFAAELEVKLTSGEQVAV